MPKVILQKGEFKKHHAIKLGVDTLTVVEIPQLWETFKTFGSYIQINEDRELRTIDKDGNPKRLSCFNLPH